MDHLQDKEFPVRNPAFAPLGVIKCLCYEQFCKTLKTHMKLILKEKGHFENCLINKIIPNLDKKYSNSFKKEKLVHALDKGHTTAPMELKHLLLQ